jgi:putative transposase
MPAPDLVRRNFAARAPDRLWVAHITYITLKNEEGLLYPSFVLDAYSRRPLGGAMVTRLRTALVVAALQMAIWRRRRPSAGLIHHSDQEEVQYTSLPFGKRFEEAGIVPSMGKAGSAYDNALAESFVATLKSELLYRDALGRRGSASGRRSSSIY